MYARTFPGHFAQPDEPPVRKRRSRTEIKRRQMMLVLSSSLVNAAFVASPHSALSAPRAARSSVFAVVESPEKPAAPTAQMCAPKHQTHNLTTKIRLSSCDPPALSR